MLVLYKPILMTLWGELHFSFFLSIHKIYVEVVLSFQDYILIYSIELTNVYYSSVWQISIICWCHKWKKNDAKFGIFWKQRQSSIRLWQCLMIYYYITQTIILLWILLVYTYFCCLTGNTFHSQKSPIWAVIIIIPVIIQSVKSNRM